MPTCRLFGCDRACYRDQSGHVHDFCCRSHYEETLSGEPRKCDLPRCDKERNEDDNYCSEKHEVEHQRLLNSSECSNETEITILKKKDSKYESVRDQFMKKWIKDGYPTPSVQSIVEISPGKALKDRYEKYREKIIALRTNLKPYGNGGEGNEQRRFHGTSQLCSFGSGSSTSLCSNASCAVCGIIKSGWKINLAGTSKGIRFGPGSYFTSCSSKSHDYNEKSENGLGKRLRSMFLAKVIVGNGYILTTNNYTANAPPSGFDSLIADKKKTPKVNYDELIIFNEHAALPKYLIIYKY